LVIENWSWAIENQFPERLITNDKFSIFNSQLLAKARFHALFQLRLNGA
jgi:hypothetical protein